MKDDWKDYSAGMAKLGAAKVNLLLGLYARAQDDIGARLDAIRIIDRCMLQVSDEYEAWKVTL